MAKPKFSLDLAPTFKATVDIPVPGGKSAPIEFIFKGRSRSQFDEFMASLGDQKPDQLIMQVATGWELDAPFDQDSIDKLTENFMGAGFAIWEKYLTELTKARSGN